MRRGVINSIAKNLIRGKKCARQLRPRQERVFKMNRKTCTKNLLAACILVLVNYKTSSVKRAEYSAMAKTIQVIRATGNKVARY